MRKSKLLSASSIGLVFASLACVASVAVADTSVSTARTTPLVTSTDGNIAINTGGSVTLTSGTAITVNSDNTVSVEGPINMDNSSNGSTAILVEGGRTSNITVKSTITVAENFTATDTNNDGIIDGPFASGNNRYAIHSLGTTPFVGNVDITSSAGFLVEGDNSYGIRFENGITGNFKYDGSMTITGNNSVGIGLENGVTGNVYLSGSITARGKNTSAIKLAGDYSGAVVIDGTYAGSGYATTATLSAEALAKLTPDDYYQSDVLVRISGNVANGILLGSTVTSTVDSNTDEDGNGIDDSTQSSASLSQFGSAPALQIASATQDITIGGLTFASTAINPPSVHYGLSIKGSVNSSGIYKDVDANAVQLGGLGHSVTIQNGISITGVVSATGYQSSAIGINLKDGASTPRFDVGGSIFSSVTTKDGDKATSLNITSGASLAQINVAKSSFVAAVANGSTGKAVAIIDRSDTVTSINNSGTISAVINASDDNDDDVADELVNRPIAIDLSGNTVAVNISQLDDTTDTTVANPQITGDILLGSGNDTISSSGGTITGNIDFGAGTNSFTLTNAAVFSGKLSSAGTVDLDISKGTATLSKGSNLNVGTFHVGSDSVINLVLNSATPSNPILSGTGAAVFDNGADLNLSLDQIVINATKYTVLKASSIDLGNLNLSLTDVNVPYIYKAGLSKSTDNTTLYADFALKNQSEGAYTHNEYAALLPVLVSSTSDAGTTNSLLAAKTEAEFKNVLNQFLPNYSGENLLGLANSVSSMTESLGTLSHLPKSGTAQYWLQEHGFNQTRDAGETIGFDSTGFNFAAGRETSLSDNSAVGVFISYTSASPSDGYAIANETLNNSDVTVGGYWRIKTDRLRGWAHIGVGYVSFDSNRQLITTNTNHQARAKWHGNSASLGVGVSYDYPIGSFVLTPVASASYYSLKEDAYTELGGTDSFNLFVASRSGQLASGRGIIRLRYDKWTFKPEVYLGFKTNLIGDAGKTKAHFKNGADFILNGGDLTGSGLLGGVRVFMDSEWSYFSLQAGFEQTNDITDSNIELRTRFSF